MPKDFPTPCNQPGCKRLAVKGGRCERHPVGHGWKHKQNRHKRGYGAEWYKKRAQVLKRDDHQCQECLRNGRYYLATQVDHIKPKSQGGTDDLNNLEAICKACHDKKTIRERQP